MKTLAIGLHLLGVSMLISGVGVLVYVGDPVLAIIPIGSTVVAMGSLLFDFRETRETRSSEEVSSSRAAS